nr:MAG TPA: hypothetical protein [Caudoviricetes sp.]
MLKIRKLTLNIQKLEGFYRCVGDMGVCGAKKP